VMTKVIAVVGAGPGIGLSVALRFAKEGFTVALLARNKEKLAERQKEIEAKGGHAIVVSIDVADPHSVTAAFKEVRDTVGDPEVLVFNPGVFTRKPFLELTNEDFERSWKVNCFGGFLCAKEVLPKMVEHKRGTILLTGATAAVRGSNQFAAFAAGKFGLRAVGQSLAREFGPQGIHVAHIVVDGVVDTPVTRQWLDLSKIPIMEPAAIAQEYWNLYSQHPSAWTQELDLRPSAEKW